MSTGELSTARLGRLHDVTAGYVERGDVHVELSISPQSELESFGLSSTC